jgi:hypothetical protein
MFGRAPAVHFQQIIVCMFIEALLVGLRIFVVQDTLLF